MQVVQLKDSFQKELQEAGEASPDWVATRNAVVEGKKQVDKNFSVEDGLLLWKGRWFVPENKQLWTKILQDNHDSRIAGHFGIHKTLERLKHNHHWVKMEEDVTDYIRSCDTCQWDKPSWHKKCRLLEPLEVPYQPWSSILMDWITELPESGGCTQIWVVVNRFTKMVRLVPLPTNATSQDLTKAFLQNVWLYHGLPNDIITDRDSKVTSHFWQALMDSLGITRKLSTAFHPETDGQSKRINQILKEYLRHYCSWKQDDWEDLLPLAEFAIDSCSSETTAMSPFEAKYGYLPRQTWQEQGKLKYHNPPCELLESMCEGAWDQLGQRIMKARVRMARWQNAWRQEQLRWKPGDLIMLDNCNIATQRPSCKLDYEMVGPLRILKQVGSRAYKLELPPNSKVHPEFQASLLEPYRQSKNPHRQTQRPEMEILEGEENWNVRDIVESRRNGRKRGRPVEYLVLWEGYLDEKATWEPFEHLARTSENQWKEFHRRNLQAEKDAWVRI